MNLLDSAQNLAWEVKSSTTWTGLFAVVSSFYLAYCLALVVYRLTLHPLARFPGPLFCRISWAQQCYYEAILNGRFLEQIEQYHLKYGPVVRINPNQVHINDPAVFHEIYKQNTSYTKDPIQYGLGVSKALAFTFGKEAHKIKRQSFDPLFAKRRINLLEDELYEEIELVFNRINEYEERGEEVPIQEMYYCYTGDVISRFLYGKSLDLISASNFTEQAEQFRDFTRGIWVAIHFQFIRQFLIVAPRWLTNKLNVTFANILAFCETIAKEAIEDFHQPGYVAKPALEETIFDRLLNENARRRKKNQDGIRPIDYHELADESIALVNGGTEPTATMMAYATYFFLRYPEARKRVMDEIESVGLDEKGRLPLQKVESLPYFTGFIRETLRHVPLVPGRLPRVVPKGGLYVPSVNDFIPEGTVVGISHLHLHMHPDIFERPKEFEPERWMGQSGKELNYWLLSFSKGSADCIGKTLAYAEMHLVLANLFSRYQLEMVPGTHEGMVWSDRVIIHPKRNLHVKVRRREVK